MRVIDFTITNDGFTKGKKFPDQPVTGEITIEKRKWFFFKKKEKRKVTRSPTGDWRYLDFDVIMDPALAATLFVMENDWRSEPKTFDSLPEFSDPPSRSSIESPSYYSGGSSSSSSDYSGGSDFGGGDFGD